MSPALRAIVATFVSGGIVAAVAGRRPILEHTVGMLGRFKADVLSTGRVASRKTSWRMRLSQLGKGPRGRSEPRSARSPALGRLQFGPGRWNICSVRFQLQLR